MREFLFLGGVARQTKTLNMISFKDILEKNYIFIDEREYPMILVHFDPSGTGQQIDLDELE
jgi:hypothetical protein